MKKVIIFIHKFSIFYFRSCHKLTKNRIKKIELKNRIKKKNKREIHRIVFSKPQNEISSEKVKKHTFFQLWITETNKHTTSNNTLNTNIFSNKARTIQTWTTWGNILIMVLITEWITAWITVSTKDISTVMDLQRVVILRRPYHNSIEVTQRRKYSINPKI